MTTDVSELADRIREAFPLASVEVDPPLRESGAHHLDVRLGDRLVVVEWSEQRGIGISLVVDAALDGGPDFHLADANAAFGIVALLLTEAQDADFRKQLGNWTAESDGAPEYVDYAVVKSERRAPRDRAA